MTGIDTNILVRYFVQDHLPQNQAAARFFGSLSVEQPGYLSMLAIAELWWVLTRSYKILPGEIFILIRHLLDSEDLILENCELVEQALNLAESNGVDIADCLIASSATQAGCTHTVTFDQKAARFAGMTLLA